MQGLRETQQGTQVLYRIRTLLVSLAGLAQRASTFAPSVRIAVLWILRPVEARVRLWMLDQDDDHGEPYLVQQRDTQADALALAERFMELAAALQESLLYAEFYVNDQFCFELRDTRHRPPVSSPSSSQETGKGEGQLPRSRGPPSRQAEGETPTPFSAAEP